MGKTKKTSRMGRPPLPKTRLKSTLVVVRVTPAFDKALRAAAKKAKKPLAAFIRDTLAGKMG